MLAFFALDLINFLGSKAPLIKPVNYAVSHLYPHFTQHELLLLGLVLGREHCFGDVLVLAADARWVHARQVGPAEAHELPGTEQLLGLGGAPKLFAMFLQKNKIGPNHGLKTAFSASLDFSSL